MEKMPVFERRQAMRELFVDNFAGGGGASTGIELAIGRSVDIAINHDPDAIAMHKANHPRTKHYCEDVWQVDPVEACAGKPVALAWFSPDCKHFSRAKGGKPVDKNIRGLAWVAVKWAYHVRPRVLMMENVPEIITWGPLGEDNKPIKERAGETFAGFLLALTKGIPLYHPAFEEMCDSLGIEVTSQMAMDLTKGLGYEIEYSTLKSCDYGAPTTRTRFYMIARCDGKKIVWPKPTHGPRKGEEVKAGKLLPYRTAAECIDWTIPAVSVFEREKTLAENTLRRIARGIQKFVIENLEPFIVTVNHAGKGFRGQKIDEPLMTRDTSNRYALSVAHIMKNYAGNYQGAGSDVSDPLDTITAKDHNSLVTAHILTLRNNMNGQPADEPLTTVSCSGAHHAEVQAFLEKYSRCDGRYADDYVVVNIHGEKYIITDIKMRMLQPRELFNCQGFPDDYVIDLEMDGKPYPKSKQVARCGNAVTPPVPAALVRANLPEQCRMEVSEVV